MTIDPKKAEEYGKKILGQYKKDPTKLGPHEERLARKYYEASDGAEVLNQNIKQIDDQIYQAQARIRSLELQYKENIGKAAAFLEYIIAVKFDADNGAAPKELKPKKPPKNKNKSPRTQRKKVKKSRPRAP